MATAPESAGFNPLDVLRVLRTAGSALLTQVGLHGQLVRVEWEAEKDRIVGMAVAALIAFASLVCTMLMAGALALAFSWDTRFRIPVAIVVVVVYASCLLLAWHRFKTLSAQSQEAFAGTREELAEDLALIRKRL